ncbi:DUF3068 domain-containing protein [Nocardioides ferulae]|uniref:DUF3068 domain-containing protein n=1 Tax=Nocardioides ferulae TaxID=2340821 RepID=UPI0013DE2173|nr:DUF3068 domain-containing protein [Nocardioides ferulae]
MRNITGRILLGLGGFLLVAGVLATVWAPGMIKKTPEDVNTTTRLSGTLQKLEDDPVPIRATSVTKTDAEATDDQTAVWVNTVCVVVDQGNPPDCGSSDSDERLFKADVDVFATDRVSAEAVNDIDTLPADATPHEGLVNKWPFDAEKQDYPYWDGTTGQAVTAAYDRTENLEGIEAYVYKVEISDAPIEIMEGVPGTYDTVKEIWVEPRTGAVINQTEDQQRYLEDGSRAVSIQLAFSDEQLATSIADAEENLAGLDLMLRTVPMIGFIGGGLCLLAGAGLLLTGRPSGSRREATLSDEERVSVSA